MWLTLLACSRPLVDTGVAIDTDVVDTDVVDTDVVDTDDTDVGDTDVGDTDVVDTDDTDVVDTDEPDTDVPERVPDFSLLDTNPTSLRYGMAVSPRDYLKKVAGYYFTHAT